MTRIKPDMGIVSLNQLCTLTGKTYRTLKKALENVDPCSDEGGTLSYVAKDVLPLIYQNELAASLDALDDGDEIPGGKPKLNPVQEKARLDKLRGDKVELELETLRRNLIPREELLAIWGKIISATRQRVLAIENKLAPKLEALKDPKDAGELVRKECIAALEEISKYDPGSQLQSTP